MNEIYPATRGNEITKEYYYHLKREINDGLSEKRVDKINHKGGRISFHLTSVYGGVK